MEIMGCARILPVVNSLEVHPGHRNDALLAFCRSQVLFRPDTSSSGHSCMRLYMLSATLGFHCGCAESLPA